ncbi:hypothetical protein [Streptomyces griseorubiginosus]|uniref:hypothetical protein n=1 Tax=Streptomyces griseorubiginosus TaxID=67304 RepID=UPI0013A6A08C|nr:hypothetical protein [Streptomyces griseorubiginosus]
MRHRVSGDRRGGEPTQGESYDNHPSVGSTAPADAVTLWRTAVLWRRRRFRLAP